MPRTASATNIIKETTSRDFSGGLNVADSELNLSSKFARVLDNLIVGLDGSLEVRQGTELFADISEVSSYNIENIWFFFRYLISVNTRGEIFATTGAGVTTAIWTPAIAAAKRPGLTIWPTAGFVTFAEFGGELIIANGIDKPLHVTTLLNVDYLADLGSGSNINVPVGNVMAAYANHLFIVSDSYMLNISERNAAGTWLGDFGAIYVNQFDLRPYVSVGDTEVIGMFVFKGFLLINFREVIVPITITEDATATPKLNIAVSGDSVINNYGAISSRVGQDVGDLSLTCDIAGVSAMNLNNFTRILAPDRPSRLIDPQLQKDINELDSESLKEGAFSLFDRKLSSYMLFLPNDTHTLQTTNNAYFYRYVDRMDIKAWSKLKGWNWSAAARSAEGRVFFALFQSTKIFLLGDSKINPLYRDFMGDQETFSDGTYFTDGTGFGPVSNFETSGLPIEFVWELPWSDLKHRGLAKTLRYVIFDTEGDQEFLMRVFIDDMYTGAQVGEPFSDGTLFTDGTGWIPYVTLPFTPALELDFIAKDAGAYGIQAYGNSPYGGGNNTAVRKLTLSPTKFNTVKLRMSGRARGPLKFVAITLLFQQGTIRRLP